MLLIEIKIIFLFNIILKLFYLTISIKNNNFKRYKQVQNYTMEFNIVKIDIFNKDENWFENV